MSANPQTWRPPSRPFPKLKRAVWLAMAAMTSFFLAMTYAYLQRHAVTTSWRTPALVKILTVNTAILLASSAALERARRALTTRQSGATLGWIAAAFGLGIGFLAGQAVAWRALFRAGAYIGSTPNSGFFYLVTAAHAAHLTIGLTLIGWLVTRAWRGRLKPDRPAALEITAIIWHCLDLTWLYLYAILLWYR